MAFDHHLVGNLIQFDPLLMTLIITPSTHLILGSLLSSNFVHQSFCFKILIPYNNRSILVPLFLLQHFQCSLGVIAFLLKKIIISSLPILPFSFIFRNKIQSQFNMFIIRHTILSTPISKLNKYYLPPEEGITSSRCHLRTSTFCPSSSAILNGREVDFKIYIIIIFLSR